jgi:hypothetical protein
VYRITFTKRSNPAVFNCFLRAIDNLTPTIGGNISELKRGLEEHYGDKLISHEFENNESKYVFEFSSEREYLLFLISV